MEFKRLGEGVYGTDDAVVTCSMGTVIFLKQEALSVPRKRSRLCAHNDLKDPVHEMLIVLAHDTYIPPHAHNLKTESYHVIEGSADLILFDNKGGVEQIIRLGNFKSQKTFYFRINKQFFHTIIVHSPFLVIHETTTGPFCPDDTKFAEWAPHESAQPDAAGYLKIMREMTRPMPTGKDKTVIIR